MAHEAQLFFAGGAVPVILAAFGVIEGVPPGIEHLDLAFFAVLAAAGLRAPRVNPLAARFWAGQREQVTRHALLRSRARAELEVS